MARITTCDATGEEIPVDTPSTGPFGHQYSDAARVVAEKYIEELDALHTRHAESFRVEMLQLRARYREKLRELPDDPP